MNGWEYVDRIKISISYNREAGSIRSSVGDIALRKIIPIAYDCHHCRCFWILAVFLCCGKRQIGRRDTYILVKIFDGISYTTRHAPDIMKPIRFG